MKLYLWSSNHLSNRSQQISASPYWRDFFLSTGAKCLLNKCVLFFLWLVFIRLCSAQLGMKCLDQLAVLGAEHMKTWKLQSALWWPNYTILTTVNVHIAHVQVWPKSHIPITIYITKWCLSKFCESRAAKLVSDFQSRVFKKKHYGAGPFHFTSNSLNLGFQHDWIQTSNTRWNLTELSMNPP